LKSQPSTLPRRSFATRQIVLWSSVRSASLTPISWSLSAGYDDRHHVGSLAELLCARWSSVGPVQIAQCQVAQPLEDQSPVAAALLGSRRRRCRRASGRRRSPIHAPSSRRGSSTSPQPRPRMPDRRALSAWLLNCRQGVERADECIATKEIAGSARSSTTASATKRLVRIRPHPFRRASPMAQIRASGSVSHSRGRYAVIRWHRD
jgi:hypothetical protein